MGALRNDKLRVEHIYKAKNSANNSFKNNIVKVSILSNKTKRIDCLNINTH